MYSNVSVGRQWYYLHAGKRVSPRMKYRLSANNGEFLAAVASCGQALVSGPVALLQNYIDSGALVPILTEFARPEVGMYAVYPPGRDWLREGSGCSAMRSTSIFRILHRKAHLRVISQIKGFLDLSLNYRIDIDVDPRERIYCAFFGICT